VSFVAVLSSVFISHKRSSSLAIINNIATKITPIFPKHQKNTPLTKKPNKFVLGNIKTIQSIIENRIF